jgi:hypothetical protein
MLRIYCLQLWWNLGDPAMEEELHERPLYRRFVGLEGGAPRGRREHYPAVSPPVGRNMPVTTVS